MSWELQAVPENCWTDFTKVYHSYRDIMYVYIYIVICICIYIINYMYIYISKYLSIYNYMSQLMG